MKTNSWRFGGTKIRVKDKKEGKLCLDQNMYESAGLSEPTYKLHFIKKVLVQQ